MASRDPELRRIQRERQRFEALCGIAGSDLPICVCCGEERVWSLTFDHRHGGGTQHRAENGGSPTVRIVRSLHKTNGVWPTDLFQILCATCNHGRRVSRDGRCPHETEREEVKMEPTETKAVLGTVVRVFLAAVLAQFIAGGADVFAVDGDGLRTIVSAGVAAVALAAANWLNPSDHRYGVKH
jgi:hypothetical protein